MRAVLAASFVMAALVGAPRPASADLVKMASGTVMSVESCRFEGDTAVLTSREGGVARIPRSAIAEVLPDEVEHPKPAPNVPVVSVVPVVRGSWSEPALHALVDRLAARYGVNAKLAHAVVQVESNYKFDAVSPKGAKGLMQLMPDVAQQFGVDNPFDPEKNVDAGLRHLKDLLSRFTTSVALAAYNAGEAAVSRHGGIPPFRETQDYVQRIMGLLRR